jgi:2-oxoglutarate ferredoxin oxidoreductase subunit beta
MPDMKKVHSHPISLTESMTHYCAGCGHGIAHRLIAEVLDELGVREKTVGVAPVGCAVLAYDYWNFDVTEAAHGRAPSVAIGMKKVRPDLVVFSYQGDGDLAAIGTAEIIHSSNRGDNITVIFVNNAVYGMTGGQMAPTTLIGQKTATSIKGRDEVLTGQPIKVCELLSGFKTVKYLARHALNKPQRILEAKASIKKAFLNQIENKGFSLVELLSPCPTYWGCTPRESLSWIDKNMVPNFPLGIIKDE